MSGSTTNALDIRAVDGKALRQKPPPKVQQELRVFITEAAFDGAVARGDAEQAREVGGVLVGEVLRDDSGPYVLVEATIDALHAEEKGAEVTFTHDTWEHIHKEMDTRFAGKKVVGWYHTHPGFGIFLSDRDQFIHREFFNLPFQIALVYDPKSRAHGVFTWQSNEARRARRYFIGAAEHLWDGARPPTAATAAAAPAASAPAAAEGAARALPLERGDLVTLALGALVVAVLAATLGWWLGSRSSADLASRLEAELVEARREGARQAVGQLNIELLGVLRATLGDEAVRRPMEEVLLRLAEAQLLLAPRAADDGVRQVVTKLQEAREITSRLREDRLVARGLLGRLEDQVRAASGSVVERELSRQRTALAQVYVELAVAAAAAGDQKRAVRYLQTAATVDPENRARYLREAP